VPKPHVELRELDLSKKGHKGLGVYADLHLTEGQSVGFVLRIPPNPDREIGKSIAVVSGTTSSTRPLDDPLISAVSNWVNPCTSIE
jgi:hypothetical protein